MLGIEGQTLFMHCISRLSLLGAIALGLGTPGVAITWRHDVGDTPYLTLGDSTPHTSVGQVNSIAAFASGTYIGFGNGSHWVLTAGHVTSEDNLTDVRFGSQSIPVTGTITHPNFGGGGVDLGLVRLSTAPTGIAPIRFSTFHSLIGQNVTFAGFGASGPGDTSNRIFDDENRAAENIVEFTTGNGGSKLWWTVFSDPNIEPALPLEGSTAVGDSGGGMFWHDGTDWRLAGVTSFGTDQFSRYGDQAAFVALHANTAWLEDMTGITAVPEPASMVVLGAGLLALARRRRKPQA